MKTTASIELPKAVAPKPIFPSIWKSHMGDLWLREPGGSATCLHSETGNYEVGRIVVGGGWTSFTRLETAVTIVFDAP